VNLLKALFLLAFLALPSRASDVYISVGGRGGDQGLALGLPPFLASNTSSTEDAMLSKQLREIVRSDLLFSRYFSPVEPGPLFTGANWPELLSGWRGAGAAWLVTARAGLSGPQAVLSVRLTNLQSGEPSFERTYRQDPRFLRSLAHKASDDIVQAATGKPGLAHTQIAFSGNTSGRKELYLVDYDGENLRTLTRDRSIALLPRFNPVRRELAYTSYKDGNPDLFILNLENGKSRAVSTEQGLNVAGGFSPDGNLLSMTLSMQKNPNLFLKNLSDGSVTRLTQHFGVDSSPTFSPDGAQVAFVSDRSGNPQVYVIDIETHRTRKLTRDMNWCDSPAWSPTGEWITFAGRLNRRETIDIFIVDVTGNQVRQLTKDAGSNENPSWSPDGRFIAFTSTRNKKPEIFVMDADGSAPHRLADIPGGAYTPAWGP
jgi:TolB protein